MHVFLLIVQPKASFRVDQTKLLQQPFCLPAWNYFLSWKVNLHMPTLAQHAKYCIKTESCTDSALRGPDRIGGTLDSWRIRIPWDGSYLIAYKKNIINVALYNWKLNDGKESCWFQTVWSNRKSGTCRGKRNLSDFQRKTLTFPQIESREVWCWIKRFGLQRPGIQNSHGSSNRTFEIPIKWS